MRGRADIAPTVTPIGAIAADAAATAQRMRADAERLGELAGRAKDTIATATDRAMDMGAKALGDALEIVAERANHALEEFFGSVLGRAPTAPIKPPERKALKP